MKKHVHKKILALAVMAGFFTASAQEVVENFQSWDEANTKVPPTTDANNGCDKVTLDGTTDVGGHSFMVAPIADLSLTKTYGTLSVTYTITQAAVLPGCNPKGAYKSTTSPLVTIADGVSRGYVELNKAAAPYASGTLVTSEFEYIDSVSVSLSGTSSARHASVEFSTDGGSVWTSLIDNSGIGKGGIVLGAAVKQRKVILRVSAYDNIIRLHDLKLFTAALGTSDLFLNGTATVRSSDNKLVVASSETATVEVVSSNGVLVAQSDVVAGNEKEFNVTTSGMYIVKLVTSKGVSTKKIIVQ